MSHINQIVDSDEEIVDSDEVSDPRCSSLRCRSLSSYFYTHTRRESTSLLVLIRVLLVVDGAGWTNWSVVVDGAGWTNWSVLAWSSPFWKRFP